jgi:hypothetical protein
MNEYERINYVCCYRIMSNLFCTKRYHLKGEKKGKKEIFIDRLPGMPDDLRSNGKGGFYIPLGFPRIDSVRHRTSLQVKELIKD